MTVTMITLSGFLGAGKTTTMLGLARTLQQRGQAVAVITNDQGTELVDTKLVRSQLDAVAEVTGGCFCCRFEDLTTVVDELISRRSVDTVIAEAVGSCTDLQATVVRPLRAYHSDRFTVAPLVTVVDPWRLRAFRRAAERADAESDLAYLFGRQLAEAEIIAVNKVDTIKSDELGREVSALSERFPAARIITYSARTADGIADLTDALGGESTWADDLDVDYDRYAAAEAQLAWLNQQFRITSTAGSFVPPVWARAVLSHLAGFADDEDITVGHVKVTVDTPAGLTKLSITGTSREPSVDLAIDTPTDFASATVNARVSCEPDVLDVAVKAAVAHADTATGAESTAADATSFKPSYPRPVHRLTAADSPA